MRCVICCLLYIRGDVPLKVDCDASEHSVAATFCQEGRLAAFFQNSLIRARKFIPLLKKALVLMEAMRRWSHYHCGKSFDLVSDQRALSFMLDKMRKSKVKNRKIQLSRAELGCSDYRIHHGSGKFNIVSNSLSRIQVVAITYSCNLEDIYK